MKHFNFFYLNLIMLFLWSMVILFLTNALEHSLYTIGGLAIFSYAIFFTSWFIHYKIKLNFYTIFLILTLVFYFGQFILLLIGIPMESGRTILDNRLPINNLIDTGVFIINSLTLLNLGVILGSYNINRYNYLFEEYKKKPNEICSKDIESLKKAASIILLISIFPSVSILVENIYITMTQGYGAIFQSVHYTTGGFDNIRRFVSQFTLPSFLLALIVYKNDSRLRIIQVLFVVYLSLYFLSGSRMSGVMLILISMVVIHYWYKPIKFKNAFIHFLGGILLLTLVSTVSSVRNELYLQSESLKTVSETIIFIWNENPLYSILEEAGFTFLATATVLTYSPIVIPHQWGISYVYGVLMLFPNLFWDVHPAAAVNTDIIFSGFLTQYGGIGSSFIAELYWNFGNYAYVFVLVFGSIIGLITKMIAKYAAQANVAFFFISVYAGWIILTYVRSDTISFWRNFIYYGVSLIFVAYIIRLVSSKAKR